MLNLGIRPETLKHPTMNNKTQESLTIEITYCVEWGFLSSAASLAAAIKDNFGITVTLKEGHGGIYEISVNEDLIYSNQKKGGQFPENAMIFQEISKYRDPLPGKEIMKESPQAEGDAPSCKWPPWEHPPETYFLEMWIYCCVPEITWLNPRDPHARHFTCAFSFLVLFLGHNIRYVSPVQSQAQGPVSSGGPEWPLGPQGWYLKF